MCIEELYRVYRDFPDISTDTRQIRQNCIFFALKGANFNGNAFAYQALKAGARYVVIDEPEYKINENYILVDNVLETLQELARFHSAQWNIPVIGVTGTNGKTTTKELLYTVLSQKYRVYATRGNLNNHIGVPLTVLAVDDSYEAAVIEMGANHVGEIAFLCGIAQPTHGLITNVGKAHLEGFGSFEGVKKAKGELYDYLQDHRGTLFIQGDNSDLAEMAAARNFIQTVKYGKDDANDVIGHLLVADPYLSISWKKKGESSAWQVSTNLTGSYNLENFLAAIAVGLYLDVEPEAINRGIEMYTPTNNRSQITKTDRNTVIADFYNANASSMAVALDNMSILEAPHKVVILGDMFELGNESYEEHRKIVMKAKTLTLDRLIFVGKEFYKHRDETAEFYESTDLARARVATLSDSFILLKASRGMAFERLLEVL
ncbi:UDP-N-acetylmuramoyl-tripeptide--D-alanyl-D-alanine ligase [Sphingobacterium sp. SGG-5]|uniref:UDP-N-acetylmuramoyl-tripeptide--D-alanyl-D- alanine ligase n=1 Tax=Sphingobacterium sp. SGG-5 TaxID=2710881 RepID=UPI0013ECF684|nr:UDP-N-acetylmuramoyl-tripeptide--D-alanyl-D-alanine ligase [Sphingobacterium sp. SGG-5]NGM61190.1 UDP-N-acetylmuramoyl-tripeptide--D-alanyl-D-alanine ligase [Sphingobacterium sp. SGG-5]